MPMSSPTIPRALVLSVSFAIVACSGTADADGTRPAAEKRRPDKTRPQITSPSSTADGWFTRMWWKAGS